MDQIRAEKPNDSLHQRRLAVSPLTVKDKHERDISARLDHVADEFVPMARQSPSAWMMPKRFPLTARSYSGHPAFGS